MSILRKFSSILHNSNVRLYAKNTSWMMADNLLRLIAGLFVGIYVARYLGPEQFGIFSYCIAFSGLFAAIAKLGLDNIVVRELVKDHQCSCNIIGTAFWLKIGGALLAFISVLIALIIINIECNIIIYTAIIAFGMFFQSFDVVDFYFQSRVLSRYVSLCKIAQLIFSTLFKLYGIFANADLLWFVIITMLDQLTLGISLCISLYVKEKISFLNKFNKKIAISLLRESWPLIVAGISITLYMRIDQIMISYYLNNTSVGVFSAAVRLSEAFYLVPTIICTSIFPALINAKKKSEIDYNKKSIMLFELMAILAIVTAVSVSLLADSIINMTFGSGYEMAVNVLKIHIWACVFVFLGIAGGRWLIAENLVKQSMYRTLAGAFTNIFLNFWLIQKYGIAGAAYSTLISQFIASVAINAFSKKTRACFFMQIQAMFFPFRSIIKTMYR